MKFLCKLVLCTVIFATLILAFGCKKDENAITLTISAAASMKDSMDEIKLAYIKEKPEIALVYNFGGSGHLQQQIEQGAEVDIFISAALKQMKELEDKHLLSEDMPVDLLENTMVLIVPKNDSGITGFMDLTNGNIKKIALAEPKSVPAGQYAEEVLKKLNIFENIKSKFVYGNDVKQALTWVETGNAEAGIVYETDAKASDKVKVVEIAPKASHEPVLYPAAIIKTSKNMAAAREFMGFLTSEKAKVIFEKYGFKFIGKG